MSDGFMSNRHPADRLGAAREQIKAWQQIEEEAKAALLEEMNATGAPSSGGVEWIASKQHSTRKGGLDEKAMIAARIDVEKYRKPATEVVSVKVERRAS